MTTLAADAVRWRDALGTIGLWLGATVVLATGGYYAAAALAPADAEAPTLTAVLIAYLVLPLAALVVYRPRGVRDRLAVRAATPGAYGTAVLLWVVLLAVGAVVYLLVGAATGDLSGPVLDVVRDATDFSRFRTATTADWALIVPRALLLAGITEELLFRGILFGWLRSHLPWWATATVTTVLFAGIHAYYPMLLPFVLVLGMGLAWLRERTGSILPGILVHVLTDALLFVLAVNLAVAGTL